MDLANDTANNGHASGLADMMSCFKLFGTVKEIHVDDTGLNEFYHEYYTYPMYKDDNLFFYNDFFGKRTVTLPSYNPFKLVSEAVTVKKRLSEKNVSGNIKGEGLVQGGVIVFDKCGKPRYAYEEETGKEMNMDDIIAALKDVHAASGAATADKL
jgi:hypothetical protein